MEEILASIRRIISDEVASGSREAPASSRPMAVERSAADTTGENARRDLPASRRLAEEAIDAEADPENAAAHFAVGDHLNGADENGHPGASQALAEDDSVPAAEVFAQAADAPPIETARPLADLPAFVSRSAMNAARNGGSLGYTPVGRPVASEPFVNGRRAVATLAGEPASRMAEATFTPAPRPSLTRQAARAAVAQALPVFAPVEVPEPAEVQDQDERFAAALLDLDLVEQAVQAELAIMSGDAAEAATVASEPTQPIVAAETADVAESSAPEAAPVAADHSFEPSSVPEIADMQVQAKTGPVSRTSSVEGTEDRRPENRGEPRFFPAPRPAEAPTAEAPNRLVSGTTTTAVSAAFGTLARAVASNSRTVDDLVTEAIRPMLKEWLDENLPALVERLVRAEIERVSRQGL
ncbi:DUF2497 domain-containing protein [Ancylobacter sp. SL191]|uniref:DUF2497 domain-containing protein n=1 Tax=Ancylobacter sp. SL191 TaxID=2995166 RepID=UPI002D1E400D|nr:DUF2497 domain-containing protein [Ancylobacter sp. SL191]